MQKNESSIRLKKLCNKREFKINDYLHETSRLIIDTLINEKIVTLIIGHNQDWKQNINIGKRSNQNFVQIPYNKLIQMLSYKAEMVGIKVILTEESYTSKASFMDNSSLRIYKKGQKNNKLLFPFGKRVKRGLYRTETKNCSMLMLTGR